MNQKFPLKYMLLEAYLFLRPVGPMASLWLPMDPDIQ
jgi:hypothetical protein